jgi:hypothetical protein
LVQSQHVSTYEIEDTDRPQYTRFQQPWQPKNSQCRSCAGPKGKPQQAPGRDCHCCVSACVWAQNGT